MVVANKLLLLSDPFFVSVLPHLPRVYVVVCLCVCVCTYAYVRDPESLLSNKEMKSIVGTPPLPQANYFPFITSPALS